MDKKDIAERLKELQSPSGYILDKENLNQLIENLKKEANQEDLMDTSEAELP